MVLYRISQKECTCEGTCIVQTCVVQGHLSLMWALRIMGRVKKHCLCLGLGKHDST